MNASVARAAMVVLVLVAACGVLTGCSDPTEPEPKPEEIVNPDKPNANDRIVSQVVIGDASKQSNLLEVRTDRTGGYYFAGVYNSYNSVGRLNASGALAWHFRTSYSPRGICAGPSGGAVENGLIAAGAKDVDGDGESEVGYVSLLSPSGSLSSQLVYSADTSDVWLNGIVPVADSTFLVVGGVRASAVEHPFIATIIVTSAGQLEKRYQAIITTLAGPFSDPTVDPSSAAGSNWSFYAASGAGDASDVVHRVTVAWPDLEPWTVDWSFDVSAAPVQRTYVNGMCFYDGNLYMAGGVSDAAKTPLPSGGGYWASAVVGSITSSGDFRWTKLLRLTQHSEVFHSVGASPEGVFGVGKCAEFFQQDEAFGYGWISRLSASTGAVVSNWVFGDEKYGSAFRDGILEGSTVHCGGLTRREVSGAYQGWFCNADVSATSFRNPVFEPARIEANDRSAPEDAPAGARGDR